MNQNQVLKSAIDEFGVEHQVDIAIEEMAELTKELIKRRRGKENKRQIHSEIADVTIMIEQLGIIFGRKPILKEIEFKISRLKYRVEESKNARK